jgi:predicted PurR-regulated permease PerM
MTVKAIYNSTSSFIFILVVCFFGLYYFFKDGEAILKKLMDLSPLPTNQEKEIFEKFNQMTVATIKGTLIIALIQGLLIGVVFWIAGVQAPTLWGLLTAIISIIPLLGSVLVWLPVGIVLLFLGSYWQAILVLVAGAVVVSSVDNLLRPKLIEGETSLHPLLVFLSTLGGIAVFGPLGFVIGPVVIVLLIAFLEIYRTGHVNQ